jgi:hypothetical protein
LFILVRGEYAGVFAAPLYVINRILAVIEKGDKKMQAFKRRFWRAISFVVIIQMILIGLPSVAFTDDARDKSVEKAIGWLESAQNADGSWGGALQVMETSEVLYCVTPGKFSARDAADSGASWLGGAASRNNDDLFRMLSVEASRGANVIGDIAVRQNADGGWGLSADYRSDALDTVLAVDALVADVNLSVAKGGVAFLLAAQGADGGWGYAEIGESGTYLTAHAVNAIESYKSAVGYTDSATEAALMKARKRLMSEVNQDGSWGLDEGGVKRTLFACEAIKYYDETAFEKAVDKLVGATSPNGSLFDSPSLTARLVRLLELPNSPPVTRKKIINDIVITKQVGANDAISAYQLLFLDVVTDAANFNEDSMQIELYIQESDGDMVALSKVTGQSGDYAWNTGSSPAGECAAIAFAADKTTGEYIDVYKKEFVIEPYFELTNEFITYTPKIYRTGDNDRIKIDASVLTLSNYAKSLDVEIVVASEDESAALLRETQTALCGGDSYLTALKPVYFTPPTDDPAKYWVSVTASAPDVPAQTLQKLLEVFPPLPEARVDIEGKQNKKTLMPGKDDVTVSIALNGVGNAASQRAPIDYVLAIDDSSSMAGAPWNAAALAAKEIIDTLQPQDRAAIDQFNRGTVCDLTNDQEKLKNSIRSSEGATPMAASVLRAVDILKNGSPVGNTKVIFALSDGFGGTMAPIQAAAAAANAGILVYTIGLGSPDHDTLTKMAEIGGGAYLYAPTPDELSEVMMEMMGYIFETSGTDVTLKMTLPGDVIPANKTEITPKPDESAVNADGSTTLTWKYKRMIMGKKIDINLKYSGDNLEPGAFITLAKDVELTYNESSGALVTLTLDDFSVKVSPYKIEGEITTNKPSYDAGEYVVIDAMAESFIEPRKALTCQIDVTDSSGDAVETLESSLTLYDFMSKRSAWKADGVLSGHYAARLRIYDGTDLAYEAEQSFYIKPSGGFKNGVYSEKPAYDIGMTATLRDRVENLYKNYYPGRVTDTVTVTDIAGNVMYTRVFDLGNMFDAYRDVAAEWDIGKVMPGDYTVRAVVREDGQIAARSSCVVKINPFNTQNVRGAMSVSKKAIKPGESVNVTYSMENVGTSDIREAEALIATVDLDTPRIVHQAAALYELPLSAKRDGASDVPADAVKKEGAYLAVYSVEANGVIYPIASDSFTVADDNSNNGSGGGSGGGNSGGNSGGGSGGNSGGGSSGGGGGGSGGGGGGTAVVTAGKEEERENEPANLEKPGAAVNKYVIECVDDDTDEIIYRTVKDWDGSALFHVFAPRLDGWTLKEGQDDFKTVRGADVPTTVYFYYIKDEAGLHERYMFGYPDKTVRSDQAVTRAEAAALMYRLINDKAKGDFRTNGAAFSDAAGHWAQRDIEYMASVGLVSGYPDGSFKPDAVVTREELVTILVKYANMVPAVVKDTGAGGWSGDYVNIAVSNGYISGYPDGGLHLRDNASRGQTAAILNRIFNRKFDESALDGQKSPYADLRRSHWSYADIIEAAISHRYERDANGAEKFLGIADDLEGGGVR